MWKIGIAAVLFLIASVAAAAILLVRRNRRVQLQKAVMDKEREMELEQRLRNRNMPVQKECGEKQTPYEVRYQENVKTESSEIQVELTVISDVSEKKYMLPIKNEIFIGKNIQNDLVLNDKGVSRRHCCLMRKNSEIYVKDLNSTNGTVVFRKNQKTKLQGQSVKIQTGDQIFLGGIRLEVRIFS